MSDKTEAAAVADDDKLRIWNALSKTDPKHTTRFQRAGGFKGTAVKPIYQIEKMTEVFGPIGERWGTHHPHFETVRSDNGEVLVFCTVGVWVGDNERIDSFHGVGGDKVVTLSRDGTLRTNDEAYKMAFTDAVGNALKYLGMSADIHMGLFDDSKYVRDLEREFADEPAPPPLAPVAAKRTDQREIWEALRDEIDACMTAEDLNLLWVSAPFKKEYGKLGADWAEQLVDHAAQHKKEITKTGKPAAYVEPNFDGVAK